MNKEYGEFGEPKGEIKEQIEKAVEGMEATKEDALALKKREIGENIFSEYTTILERKKELEEKEKEFEGKEYYEELREGGEGKPPRLKEDERRKPATLRENINKIKEDKEKKGEIGEELEKINKKIDSAEKNNLLKEALAKKLDTEAKMSTALSGELVDEATKESDLAKVELGSVVLERYKELEKKLAKLKQKLAEHEGKKPKLEGREGKEVMSFRREERKWQEEKEQIEKEIEALKEKMSSKEILDIFLEEEEVVETLEEAEAEPEVEVELTDPVVEEGDTVVETTPVPEKKVGKFRSALSKIVGFFFIIGYVFSSILEKLKKKK